MTYPPRFRLLGAAVDALTAEDWLALVARRVEQRIPTTIVSQNLHGIHSYHRNADVRSLHSTALIRIDGMPLVYWGRILGHPVTRAHRVTWVDWLPPFLKFAAHRGWRVYHLGGPPGAASQAAEALSKLVPGLQLTVRHGHFALDDKSNAEVLAEIDAAAPHILLVGMGMPRQEKWVLANRSRIGAPVVLTCGAAFEYFAGTISASPRWMGRVGLEWLHRLVTSPRRLYRRYLIEPWSLIPHAVADLRDRQRSRAQRHDDA